MKKDFLSQEHHDNVSRKLHHSTISMALVIIILNIMILPWSEPSSAAFIPLVISIIFSFVTLIWASLSLRKQIKKEMRHKSEMCQRNNSSNISF